MRNHLINIKITIWSAVFFASSIVVANTEKTPSKETEAQTIWRVETEQTGLLEIAIDAAWYAYDFGDQWNRLIVSDRLNNRVPFRIVTPAAKAQVQQEQVTLPIFFVNDEKSGSTSQVTSTIRLEHLGTHLSVESGFPATPIKAGFYLIDLRELKTRPEILTFDWLADEAHQFLPFSLASSDDLQHWQAHGDYTVTQLSAHGKTLAQNQIRLPDAAAKRAFLRLRFDDSNEPPTMHRIDGIIKTFNEERAPERHWQLSGTPADGLTVRYQPSKRHHHKHLFKHHHPIQAEKVNAWEFVRNESATADTLFVDFSQQSFIGELRVYSRQSAQENWRNQYADDWHHVAHGAQWYSSPAIELHQNRDRYWRMEISDAITLAQAPSLEFSGDQEYLQILANEFGPFSIAIHNTADYRRLSQMRSVFAALPADVMKNKVSAAVTTISSPVASQTEEHSTASNHTFKLFWLLLILTSGVLLYFALRLLKKPPPDI